LRYARRPDAPDNESSLWQPTGARREKMLTDASFHTRVASMTYARAESRASSRTERCLGENEALSEGFLQLELQSLLPVVIDNSTNLESRRETQRERERKREREREKSRAFSRAASTQHIMRFLFHVSPFSAHRRISFYNIPFADHGSFIRISRQRPVRFKIQAIHKYSIRDQGHSCRNV